MKDMTIVLNKKIINKETNEVRLVVSIDEAERKIFSVPANEPDAEPTRMAAASFDRRWKLYEEAETAEAETLETTETEVPEMKMSDVVTKLEGLFDILNRVYFENALPKPGHHGSVYAQSVRPLLHKENLVERYRRSVRDQYRRGVPQPSFRKHCGNDVPRDGPPLLPGERYCGHLSEGPLPQQNLQDRG